MQWPLLLQLLGHSYSSVRLTKLSAWVGISRPEAPPIQNRATRRPSRGARSAVTRTDAPRILLSPLHTPRMSGASLSQKSSATVSRSATAPGLRERDPYPKPAICGRPGAPKATWTAAVLNRRPTDSPRDASLCPVLRSLKSIFVADRDLTRSGAAKFPSNHDHEHD